MQSTIDTQPQVERGGREPAEGWVDCGCTAGATVVKSTPMNARQTFDEVCEAGMQGDRLMRQALQNSDALNPTELKFLQTLEETALSEYGRGTPIQTAHKS